ncbi:MAG: hypothetical protein OXC69_05755 [Candidatus Tectomicrobia bacterium]|nr:hypothetical protein [Candidatus Tectomicrobia bacterium]
MKRFELIAVQEVNEAFRVFENVVRRMGSKFDYIMSDTAGNDERLAFVFDTTKVKMRNLFGELALRPHEYPSRTVQVHYRASRKDKVDVFQNLEFVPFDRNPFIGSFRAGNIDFTLVNTHLYFGKFQNSKHRKDRKRYARRVLEIFALSQWAARRAHLRTTYDQDIILLGDMNVPVMHPNESTYSALIDFGFRPLDYTSKTGGSNLGNDKTYDQVVFAPDSVGRRVRDYGVFDFDNAVFRSLWRSLKSQYTRRSDRIRKFNAHVKFHLSDHRPVWVQLDTS